MVSVAGRCADQPDVQHWGDAYKGSTIRKQATTDPALVTAWSFGMWRKGGGKILQGLVNRKADEWEMWSLEDHVRAH